MSVQTLTPPAGGFHRADNAAAVNPLGSLRHFADPIRVPSSDRRVLIAGRWVRESDARTAVKSTFRLGNTRYTPGS